jgi:thiamine-monophosphate kinase
MIDISDGLSSEVMHICSDSGKGCKIYEDKIPVDPDTARVAEELNLEPLTCALNGGEDYELLFTVPLKNFEVIQKQPKISIIGHVCKQDDGMHLVSLSGELIPLRSQGWNGMR